MTFMRKSRRNYYFRKNFFSLSLKILKHSILALYLITSFKADKKIINSKNHQNDLNATSSYICHKIRKIPSLILMELFLHRISSFVSIFARFYSSLFIILLFLHFKLLIYDGDSTNLFGSKSSYAEISCSNRSKVWYNEVPEHNSKNFIHSYLNCDNFNLIKSDSEFKSLYDLNLSKKESQKLFYDESLPLGLGGDGFINVLHLHRLRDSIETFIKKLHKFSSFFPEVILVSGSIVQRNIKKVESNIMDFDQTSHGFYNTELDHRNSSFLEKIDVINNMRNLIEEPQDQLDALKNQVDAIVSSSGPHSQNVLSNDTPQNDSSFCSDKCKCWPILTISILIFILGLTLFSAIFYFSSRVFSKGLASPSFYTGGGYWLLGTFLIGTIFGGVIGGVVSSCPFVGFLMSAGCMNFLPSIVLIGKRGALAGGIGGLLLGMSISITAKLGIMGSSIGGLMGFLLGLVLGFLPLFISIKMNDRYIRKGLHAESEHLLGSNYRRSSSGAHSLPNTKEAKKDHFVRRQMSDSFPRRSAITTEKREKLPPMKPVEAVIRNRNINVPPETPDTPFFNENPSTTVESPKSIQITEEIPELPENTST